MSDMNGASEALYFTYSPNNRTVVVQDKDRKIVAAGTPKGVSDTLKARFLMATATGCAAAEAKAERLAEMTEQGD